MDYESSHSADTSPTESPLAHKSEANLSAGWIPKKPATHTSYRDSYSSEVSHGSLHMAEIGRAIPVHVFGRKNAQIHEITNVKEEDDMSLVSESQMQLGRLNTIKSVATSTILPELTVNTAVESVVPPRLKRRPVSESLPLDQKVGVTQQHRLSLNINNDLDKLIESAHNFKLADELIAHLGEPELSSPPKITGHSRLDSMLSSDSYQTAGDGNSTTSLPNGPADLASVPMLPKRPNADNLERARQASHQHSARGSEILQEKTVDGDDDDSVAVPSTYLEDGRSRVAASLALSVAAPKKEIELPNVTGEGGNAQNIEFYVGEANISGTPKDSQGEQKLRNTQEILTPEVLQELHQPISQVQTPQRRKTDKALPPAPPSLLERSEALPSQVRDSVYTSDSKGDDNEYYDIEEPVLVSMPVRSKSVKESIQVPKRKSTKRRTRKAKSRDSTNLQLKPFSYNTLINLLESVNGTVIGEEFESLNLPIKEKQMIEKIVDSLSRLTLDMVIDENRYEIGMERLEKAHRVLEGFL